MIRDEMARLYKRYDRLSYRHKGYIKDVVLFYLWLQDGKPETLKDIS
jgi:hypothetical protein